MSQNAFSSLERALGYTFKDKALLKQALTHRSVRGAHNERLEFLGDSVLNFVVGYALYKKLPHAKEGDLSRYRATLVCEDSLASVALLFHLGNFLILGPGELRAGGFRRKSIMADALEAVIAAIYLDSDFLTVQERVADWFSGPINVVSDMKIRKDPKTTLQEFLQSQKQALPEYRVIKTTGADHDQVFFISCQVPGLKGMTQGEGPTRKIAEQEAAALFFTQILKQIL